MENILNANGQVLGHFLTTDPPVLPQYGISQSIMSDAEFNWLIIISFFVWGFVLIAFAPHIELLRYKIRSAVFKHDIQRIRNGKNTSIADDFAKFAFVNNGLIHGSLGFIITTILFITQHIGLHRGAWSVMSYPYIALTTGVFLFVFVSAYGFWTFFINLIISSGLTARGIQIRDLEAEDLSLSHS